MNMIQKINDEWILNSRLILCFHECNEFHSLHSFLFSTSCIHECTTISQSVNEDFSIILDFSATLINPVIVVWYFLCRKSIYKAHNLWQLSKCAKMKTHKKKIIFCDISMDFLLSYGEIRYVRECVSFLLVASFE